jgi:ABC-2 type transport system ATP-binding protein
MTAVLSTWVDVMKLEIHNVGKRYKGGIWGLRNFSAELSPGVLGLLGPNGAGKTTLMNILATVTQMSEGTVRWNGLEIAKHPHELRSVLGYLPQDFGVYPHLNAVEFLHYLAAIKGIERKAARRRIDELLQLMNLTEVAKRPLGGYSGGLRQRVGIAQALLNDPQLLIVDEPTVGLDPQERVRFRNLLADLSGDRLIILSTHIVSDVEAAATRIVLIRKGTMLVNTVPEKLLQVVEGKVWTYVISSDELASSRRQFIISGTIRRTDGVQVRLVSDNLPVAGAESVMPTLEDAYLYCISASGDSAFAPEATAQ